MKENFARAMSEKELIANKKMLQEKHLKYQEKKKLKQVEEKFSKDVTIMLNTPVKLNELDYKTLYERNLIDLDFCVNSLNDKIAEIEKLKDNTSKRIELEKTLYNRDIQIKQNLNKIKTYEAHNDRLNLELTKMKQDKDKYQINIDNLLKENIALINEIKLLKDVIKKITQYENPIEIKKAFLSDIKENMKLDFQYMCDNLDLLIDL